MKETLEAIFKALNKAIEKENRERQDSGTLLIRPVEIRILGQMTLLANDMVAKVLPLQRTGDLDAVIENTHYFVTDILKKKLLPKYGLVYDEDSEKIWIPPGSKFDVLCDLKFVRVLLLDPESALVSKAIKAKEKNRVLIAEAIAAEIFENLMERIEKHGGNLEYFLGDGDGEA